MPSDHAEAQNIGSGPLLVGGYTGDQDASGNDDALAFGGLGWRWRRDGADFLDNFLEKGHVDFSWTIEPMVAAIVGNEDTFEASVVPFARFQPLGWENVAPYFEGGIGLIYTGLDGYGLGSHVQFSDNAGIGLAFGGEDAVHWTIGYRFRHISNANIWGDGNDGLNAHFMVFAIE
ncbi:MAG: acyloxyacyl hydrolase [Deltaproteobacteria bacterium]|nr:acyloxyacyl hydrolase [Deltaproteobacteria bacterium]